MGRGASLSNVSEVACEDSEGLLWSVPVEGDGWLELEQEGWVAHRLRLEERDGS